RGAVPLRPRGLLPHRGGAAGRRRLRRPVAAPLAALAGAPPTGPVGARAAGRGIVRHGRGGTHGPAPLPTPDRGAGGSGARRRARVPGGGRHEPLGLETGRDGVLYVPDTAGPGAPLLVFLHGATGTGRKHLRAVVAAADRYGVVVAAPDSRHPVTWDVIAEHRF